MTFLGMSENLDALCVWMKFLRTLMNRAKGRKRSHFHILIPTYRPLVIKEALLFPEDLYPLSVEGHIHNSIARVWLNIPEVPPDMLELSNVGNLAEPPSAWRDVATGATFLGTLATLGGGSTASAATVTPMAPPIGAAIFLGGGIAASLATFWATQEVDRQFYQEPRVLGGNNDAESEEAVISRDTRRVHRRHRRHRHRHGASQQS
jgi:hypothetical protein